LNEIHAGKLLQKILAVIGGNGGGSPSFAFGRIGKQVENPMLALDQFFMSP